MYQKPGRPSSGIMEAMDKIMVRKLMVSNIIGVDSWERSKRQPLSIDLTVHQPLNESGDTDLLVQTLSYGTLAKQVSEFSERTQYRSVEALAAGIANVCLDGCGAARVTVRVEKPRALLHAACAGVQITRSKGSDRLVAEREGDKMVPVSPTKSVSATPAGEDQIFINDLTLSTIIGVNPWEREERQRVVITLIIHLQFDPRLLSQDHVPKIHNYRTITRTVSQYVESTDYKTVEALATSIAKLMIQQCHVPKVTVRVEKPSAIVFAAAAGVEITRDKAYFETGQGAQAQAQAQIREVEKGAESSRVQTSSTLVPATISTEGQRLPHTVFLALGSNLGDRAKTIDDALKHVEASPVIDVVDTSFLYETAPMYVADQPNFLNACCKIQTSLEPQALLSFLKGIESTMGRDFNGQRNGPRPIDLDILCYDVLEMKTDALIIPHPRIKERDFVLRPLCDIAPDMEIPGQFRTAQQLLALLGHTSAQGGDVMHKVIRLRNGSLWRWGVRTYVMGILNMTPDSFSDGGSEQSRSVSAAVAHATAMVSAGADIVDVGGQSTRPNAEEVSEEEEMNRVVPVIKALRSALPDVPISIDTYRAKVATAAIEAGADLINDVSAGTLDPAMLSTVARSAVPVCLMHMRGTPKTMTGLTSYPDDDVLSAVGSALALRVEAAVTSGVRRWNIIVDPGIGFAKDAEQSFELLRGIPRLVATAKAPLLGFPSLVGASRKRFLASAFEDQRSHEDPKTRGWATAAACSAAISAGADMIRVHDVAEMKDVAVVADRCFRAKPKAPAA
ncbi:trifunctional dihydropteroate synthetase [Thoreauomyces humboldtii]|nr:trifunctional dihydropteroate synthetase [Thoreauomyces humboldtii]